MAIFTDIGIIFIAAAIGAYLARILKQPLIPVYILVGAILGPVLGLVTDQGIITTLSEIGIAFLLFTVGLELNLNKIKGSGISAITTGVVQVMAVFGIAFWLATLMGFVQKEAMYLGFIVTLSSTMVVVKMLSDKRELDTLHSRIIVGILLVQDLFAIFALSLMTTIDGSTLIPLLISFAKGAGIVLIAFLCSKFIFLRVFKFAAESQELLMLLALAVLFTFSLAIAWIGMSITIGAFLAGVSLATLPYNIQIIGKIRSIRDFFATLFFVSLGMEILIGEIRSLLLPLIVLFGVIIIIKPLIIMVVLALFKYTKRISFTTSFSLAQISEFSLIIVTQGLLSGHISEKIFTLTVLLAILTIALTSYFIKFESRIFSSVSGFLNVFDIGANIERLQYLPKELEYDIILVGYDRIGYNIFKTMTKMKKTFMVIDFNPEIIRNLVERKIPCIYGDIGDPEILERLNLKKTTLVVSTVPELEDTLLIIRKIKHENPHTDIFVTATQVNDALRAYKEGADYVILPHFLGGEKVSVLIEELKHDRQKINMNKFAHIDDLRHRLDLKQEHPAR